jgi:hypothetical protein
MFRFDVIAAANAPLASITEKPLRQQRPEAVWTVVGSWLLLLVYSIGTGGFGDFVWYISHFFDVEAMAERDPLIRIAPMIAATVVVALPTAIAASLFAQSRYKMKGEHANTTLFHNSSPRRQFRKTMSGLTLEEVLARLIFIGLGMQIPGLDNTFGFIFLFVLGNAVWSLIHLSNMKNKSDRKWILVLPQFVAGFFFTLVYIPYGFFGALMAHVIYDVILFAADRKDVFNLGEKLLVLYHLVGFGAAAFVFFGLGNQSLMDMKLWFGDEGGFSLPGWSLIDYVSAMVMLVAALNVVMELLLFDREGGEEKVEVLDDLARIFVFTCSAFVIVPALEYYAPGANSNELIKVIVIAILGSFAVKSASGSGVARVFWESLLITPIVIGIMLALPLHHAPLVALAFVLYLALDRVIRYLDKDEEVEKEATVGVTKELE